MFKRIITHTGFWKSVAVLSLVYLILLILLQFIFFPSEVVLAKLVTISYIATLLLAGFICAFAATYGKFWRKLKTDDHKKR